MKRLKVSGNEWEAVGPGVKTAYRKGRRAFRMTQKNPSPENHHEWRKRAKDLWYQARLLRPVSPKQMNGMVRELAALCDYLGDDHDLFILRQYLTERFSGEVQAGRELEPVYELIGQRQRKLRVAALALGARLYAEKPAGFSSRLAGYWQTWRR